LFPKLDKYASNSQGSSISICMRYSQTFERGKPPSGQGWFDVRRGREPNQRLHQTGIPLHSIPAGEPRDRRRKQYGVDRS
jgi:hypothetical protein